VTLNHRYVFYLNKVAYEVLDMPAAVEMKFDGNLRIIGLKPTDPRKRNAFLVKQHTLGRYKKIHASAFCKQFRLRIEGTNLFDAAELTDEGILELPMDSMVTVGRGAR